MIAYFFMIKKTKTKNIPPLFFWQIAPRKSHKGMLGFGYRAVFDLLSPDTSTSELSLLVEEAIFPSLTSQPVHRRTFVLPRLPFTFQEVMPSWLTWKGISISKMDGVIEKMWGAYRRGKLKVRCGATSQGVRFESHGTSRNGKRVAWDVLDDVVWLVLLSFLLSVETGRHRFTHTPRSLCSP